jgi:hypothetical protein
MAISSWQADEFMATITDEYMREKMGQTKNYCIVLLRDGPNWNIEGVDKVIWERGRRNFSLKVDRVMPIVCPVNDGTDFHGIGIMNRTVEEARKIMDDDPGVKAGIFIYELHPCRSFPGDCLNKMRWALHENHKYRRAPMRMYGAKEHNEGYHHPRLWRS